MLNLWKWRAKLAVVVAAGVLGACGGGESATVATATSDLVLRVDGQIAPASQEAEVASVKRRDASLAPAATKVRLGVLDQSKLDAVPASGPRKVSVARSVAATRTAALLQQQLNWQSTAEGGKRAAVSFTAAGAYGLRLGVQIQSLPGSAMVRVYSQANSGAVYQVSGQDLLQRIERNVEAGDTSDQARTWWTPDTGGDEATLEIELPSGVATSSVAVAVGQLSHVFTDLSIPTESELQDAKINESASCNFDATCYDTYANQRNAVARMLFIRDGSGYLCSGTLMNDAVGSGTPYFLSANHCISTQTVATTLETYWFYRSPMCNSRVLSAASVRRSGGADLLYASASTDTAFMRLKEVPPSGAYFAGWDASAVSNGASMVGIHHPRGDLQKISFGSVVGQSSCTVQNSEGGFSCSGNSGNYYRVSWSSGTTEGGSSGSAVFSSGTRVVGTLYGGAASCLAAGASDYYGRFDLAYNASLNQWLGKTGGAQVERVPVYRFYNTSSQSHFFTTSAAERDLVVQTMPTYKFEGVAFHVASTTGSGLSPVFRFYNTAQGSHFYTISSAERDLIVQTMPTYKLEGTAWWGQGASGNGATPLYRFYNTGNGTHFFTTSAAERDIIIDNQRAYNYEGIGYYVWASK
jgi:hypothetical protein